MKSTVYATYFYYPLSSLKKIKLTTMSLMLVNKIILRIILKVEVGKTTNKETELVVYYGTLNL